MSRGRLAQAPTLTARRLVNARKRRLEALLAVLPSHINAKARLADERLQRFFDRVTEWEHAGSIRIPISFLVRLYPRPLDHGVPDLIESTIRLCSGAYGDPRLFEDFPHSIFTMTPPETVDDAC